MYGYETILVGHYFNKMSALSNPSTKTLRRLVYKMSNGQEPINGSAPAPLIPKCVVFLNMCLSPVIGMLMAIRGHYDGKLSLFGIILRILYFISFLVAIYFDNRFEKIERWSRILPKLFGCIILGVQLYGVVPRYDCDTSTSWRTCI